VWCAPASCRACASPVDPVAPGRPPPVGAWWCGVGTGCVLLSVCVASHTPTRQPP
jgi:hypothetical protein